jgi:hypothetical protein
MKAVHLICRRDEVTKRPKGIDPIGGNHQYTSEAWDFSPEQAESLIGGEILFHQTKAEKSFFGGKVTGYEEINRDDLARQERIKFTFTATLEVNRAGFAGGCLV